ncbi:hypothetical protein M4D55_20535 [Metabacillus idriensis]|uniref:hypothetical protein n=1 Tax=Metabacillus idriensis TaxID=324768 RepID=UPI0008A917F3|nr:hypothetical protein [Metabacillus idriensis]MCM3598153.1 hypothetical protein [Metabacillus idriensis]OHR63741.1 hypothetical protein HMPREF3291_03440 [Bacillus sp. HMSC76G11]
MNQDEVLVVSGTINNVEENKINIIGNNGVSKLVLDDESIIWKGERGKKTSELKENDFFYARGIKKDNNTLNVEIIWVNIVSIVSEVKEKTENTLTLEHEENKNIKVSFAPTTDLIKETEGNLLTVAAESNIKTGDFIQVIGLLDQNNNSVEATRIFTF